jgi:hypothetical protein
MLQQLWNTAKGTLGNLWHKAKTSIGNWAKSTFPSIFGSPKPSAPQAPSMESQMEEYYRRNPGQRGYENFGDKDVMVTKPIKPRILPQPETPQGMFMDQYKRM